MENFTEFLSSSVMWFVLCAAQITASVSLMLAMKFFAKQRGVKLSAIWYVGAWFLPVVTVIVFLAKKKKFPKINEKICPCCGNRYPEIYQLCSTCLIDLDEIDYDKKKKQGIISDVLGGLFILLAVATNIFSFAFGDEMLTGLTDDLFDYLWESSRIALTDENGNKVYYDKEGNAYEDGYDVLIYGKDGEVYTYTEVEEYDEEYEMDFTSYYYVDGDGKKFDSYFCYVDEDGWFYYDEKDELEWDDEYYAEIYPAESEEDLYAEEFEEGFVYKFYADRYLDAEGNIYYLAEDASWNADGELITVENDPTLETE